MSTATVVVQFTNPQAAVAANAHLSAEVDTRPAGLNAGKSTFLPGATAYLLVYKSAHVSLVAADSSAGSLSAAGTVAVQHTDELQFADVTTATLNVPADDIVSYKWIGRDLGHPVVGADGKTVSVPTKGVGVLSITYTATAVIGALASPTSVNGNVDFSILVLITGEVAE